MTAFKHSDLTREEMAQLNASLIKSKLISANMRDELKEVVFCKDTIDRLINSPSEIKFDSETNEAYVVTIIKGVEEKVFLNQFDVTGVEKSAEFFSSFLDEFTFPVVFYDSVEQQKEAQAAYTSIIICKCLDLQMKVYLDDLISNYDFERLRHRSDNVMFADFRCILKSLSADNTLPVKVLISACNYKFSTFKKKLNPSFISKLNSEMISALSGLKLKRATIIRDYASREAQSEVSWEKQKIRNERDVLIDELYKNSGRVGKIAQALSLNSECLTQNEKDKIFDDTIKLCNAFYKIGFNRLPAEAVKEEYNQKLRVYRRAASQIVVDQKRMDAIDAILQDENYNVIKKR